MSKNIFRTITFILIAINLLLLFSLIQQKDKFQVGEFNIDKKDFQSYLEVFDFNNFQLCELETGECYSIKVGDKGGLV